MFVPQRDRRTGPRRPSGETRQFVRELLARGLSYSQIAAELGTTKSTVAYHARRLDLPANDLFARRYDWAEIQAAYEAGMTMRECEKRFGFNASSWSQAVKRGDIVPRPRARDIELLLVKGHSKNGRANLKKRLVDAGIKEDRCEICGITEWRSQALSLQLHHVNGDGTDNRLENLQILCPNCHAQTDTWGGRNKCRPRREPDPPA